MKKILFFLMICCTIILVFGCSQTPNVTGPFDNVTQLTLTQRPTFVETRPPEVIQNFVMKASDSYMLYKKPPKPPDTGSSEDPNPNPPHKYAYVVGISDYEGTVNDLMYADDDARDMKLLLQGEGFTIRTDIDRSATAAAITDGLEWLASVAQPGDEIAFCYSGHGYKAPSYGSSIISTDLYYMTHGYIMQIFNSASCSKMLVTLDCCVIGDFHQDAITGTVMATASTNSDSYDAPDLEQGAWTYFFLEAANEQGLIYAEDIASYAEAGMKAWAKPYHLRVSPKHTDLYGGMLDI